VIIFVMGGVAYLFFKICNALTKGGIRLTRRSSVRASTGTRWRHRYSDLTLSELVLAARTGR